MKILSFTALLASYIIFIISTLLYLFIPKHTLAGGSEALGQPTLVFNSQGELVEAKSLPLATNLEQAIALHTPPSDLQRSPTQRSKRLPQSSRRIQELGDQARQQAIIKATQSLEIPVGLLHRLAKFEKYRIDLIIDDSGSMDTRDTRLSFHEDYRSELSRLEELQNSLSALVPLLAQLAVNGLIFRRFNASSPIELLKGESPQVIQETLQQCISELKACWGTPLNRVVKESFQKAVADGQPTLAFIFTDGEPTDGSFKNTLAWIRREQDSNFYPVSLVACTNDDRSVGWMNELDYTVRNVQTTDDYFSERKEVYDKHGPMLPYTLGLYLMAALLGPIDEELDNLDEDHVFKHYALKGFLGYDLTLEQYQQYRSQAQRAKTHARARKPEDKHPLDQHRMSIFANGKMLYRIPDDRPYESSCVIQ